jgi:hypothetical protein
MERTTDRCASTFCDDFHTSIPSDVRPHPPSLILFSLGLNAMSTPTRISLIITALASFALHGCGGFGFAYQKPLSGKYALVATDVMEQMSVCEMLPKGDALGVIPKTVFAVGWDPSFIIAKQHPSDDANKIDKSVTRFYILKVSDGKLSGPLTEEQFKSERDTLHVSGDLDFSLVFKELS